MEQRTICEGSRFGHLICIARDGQGGWRCRCACGNETTVDEQMLVSGVITSCGCRRSRCLNLLGERFGRLVAEKPMPRRGADASVLWLCRCDCGNYTIVSSNKLRMGHTASCGCMGVETARRKKTFIDGTCVEILLSQTLSKNNTSGYRGVSRKRTRWQAYITYAGKTTQLGVFDTAKEAAAAREKAEQRLRAYLNELLTGEIEHADAQSKGRY